MAFRTISCKTSILSLLSSSSPLWIYSCTRGSVRLVFTSVLSLASFSDSCLLPEQWLTALVFKYFIRSMIKANSFSTGSTPPHHAMISLPAIPTAPSTSVLKSPRTSSSRSPKSSPLSPVSNTPTQRLLPP